MVDKAKIVLTLKKYLPQIMTVGGVGLMGGGTVVAVKKAKKEEKVLEPYHHQLMDILSSDGYRENPESYKKQIFAIKRKAFMKLVKHYSLPVAMELAGAGLIFSSDNEMSKRYAGAVAFGNGVWALLQEERKAIQNQVKQEEEKKIFSESVDKVAKQQEIPKKKNSEHSIYSRYFDECSTLYSNNPEYNLANVKNVEDQLNQKFNARGYLFLNEAYEALGFSPTRLGCVVGWIKSNDGSTDNKINFGIWDYETNKPFLQMYEPVFLIDFNVDGVIYDKIEKL